MTRADPARRRAARGRSASRRWRGTTASTAFRRRFPRCARRRRRSDPRIARARQLRARADRRRLLRGGDVRVHRRAAAAPFAADGDLVPIANPLSENFAVLRPSALPGLVDAVAHNRRREQRDVRLFEIGNGFSRAARRAAGARAAPGPAPAARDHWSGGTRDVDFFDMKGVVERVCRGAARRRRRRSRTRERGSCPAGRRRSSTASDARRRARPAGAGRRPSARAARRRRGVRRRDRSRRRRWRRRAARRRVVEPLPRFPSVTRDISILVDDTLPSADAARHDSPRRAGDAGRACASSIAIRARACPTARSASSLRLTFRSPDRTLTDAEVQAAMDAVHRALLTEHDAVQR